MSTQPRSGGSTGSSSSSPAAHPAKGLVLVVEDEPAIADVIRRYLRAEGFAVQAADTGAAARAAIGRDRPVAVVLDIGLPDVDGLTLCRELRASGDWTPVVFVTARDEDVDRILGLELGGDDYLVKPFHPRELVARVKAVLRRTGLGSASPAATLVAGEVRVDPEERRVWVGEREIAVTTTEFELLAHLMRHPRRVFERAALLSAVWGYATPAGTRTVDVHIAALRAKLGPASPIRTVRGVGYAVDT